MTSTNETRHLKIGPYEICPIPTGLFGLDGGAMFGTVPKVLWEKSNPADEKNRIQMEARALLLKSPGNNILIDTGNGSDFVAKYGDKLGNKFKDLYNIDDSGPSLKKSLQAHGLKPEDINNVVITHFHFDHAGGATTEKDGKLVPTFPNAKYWAQKGNLETASHPNLRERASYYPANYQPLLDAGVLTLLDGDTENFLPGLSAFISNGHTEKQQMVKVTDGQTTLLYCGDVVPTSTHVKIPWLMGYDLQPVVLMEEKQKYLSQAADNNWYLFFEHDPYCDAALIERSGHDFSVQKRFWL
ncbi:MBL fold metallo-hydrolase [Bdellovibrio sp. NC01]|uniref:MBL fold metallo-hydrolase n=1 Tax=Bdellovibrio sp. NC01 TaxID=2220073 RepID=UPI0011586572|nr:MBL fold metallo-hydrolase [Bdellovibrio sp. NC01]QDK38743.1 MBL fold metallo-hydrolase [Bdellovibrio sp. NC01]